MSVSYMTLQEKEELLIIKEIARNNGKTEKIIDNFITVPGKKTIKYVTTLLV